MSGASASALSARRGAHRMAGRIDGLLTTERLTLYPVILLSLWSVTYALLRALDRDQTPLPDFAARWSAGRLLLNGQAAVLYDPSAQSALQATELHSTTLSWFVSPPVVAAAAAPLSALPYGWACALWTLISFASLAGAAWLLRPLAPEVLRRRRTALLLLAAAPTLELLGDGQDTSLCLLALALGIRLLHEGWPTMSGLALAAGTIKPHLMLLVPLVLVAKYPARALWSFCGGACLLLLACWAVVGSAGMVTWLQTPFTPLYSSEVLQGQAWKSPSLAGFLINLLPRAPRWWLTAATFLALGTTLLAVRAGWTQRHTSSPLSLWAIALLTTAVAAPHVMMYDLVLAFPALLWLATSVWSATTRALLAVTYVLLWLTAALHSLASHLSWPLSLISLPWGALGVLVLWLVALRVLGQGARNGG